MLCNICQLIASDTQSTLCEFCSADVNNILAIADASPERIASVSPAVLSHLVGYQQSQVLPLLGFILRSAASYGVSIAGQVVIPESEQ